MQAGRMCYRLRLMEPERQERVSGSKVTAWTDRGTAWAERVRLSGRRSEEAAEHFADYRAEFNVRDAHGVRAGWRVEQLGGELYSVVAVEPSRRLGMLTLVCERVNC